MRFTPKSLAKAWLQAFRVCRLRLRGAAIAKGTRVESGVAARRGWARGRAGTVTVSRDCILDTGVVLDAFGGDISIGQNVFLGPYAVVYGHGGVNIGEIWWRFPKFVVGFLLASLLITFAVRNVSFADYNTVVRPGLVLPITTLRTWAFTFSFLSIGLTTRFRDFAPAGGRPFIAFTAGVAVNVVLGFVLSVLVFGGYWANLTR